MSNNGKISQATSRILFDKLLQCSGWIWPIVCPNKPHLICLSADQFLFTTHPNSVDIEREMWFPHSAPALVDEKVPLSLVCNLSITHTNTAQTCRSHCGSKNMTVKCNHFVSLTHTCIRSLLEKSISLILSILKPRISVLCWYHNSWQPHSHGLVELCWSEGAELSFQHIYRFGTNQKQETCINMYLMWMAQSAHIFVKKILLSCLGLWSNFSRG